ncbi:MAG: RNA methyltransferase [Deltaproteobacteria bacterium]|nr:RNA methyltransferase [Deltaproteobacteria bacterium]
MTYAGVTSLNIALIHHPVINKRGEIIGSAVTNLDLHDIARMARTFGIANYFVTTPYKDQQHLVQELLEHWRTGHGAKYNPARKEALSIVSLAESVEKVIEQLTERYDRRPLVIASSALKQNDLITYGELRKRIDEEEPVLLLLGTAHGLSPDIMQGADRTLPPITGREDYNHLSVRSAASIMVDRLLGYREQ